MKSNICRIDNGNKDLVAIFKECEKVAAYNELSSKQALQLRLICEEIDGMLPNVIDEFAGDIWFEYEEGVCKVNLSIRIPEFDIGKKEQLIGIAKNKKNAAVVGLADKLRSAIEDFLLDEHAIKSLVTESDLHRLAPGYSTSVDYAYLWTLDGYKSNIGEGKEEWDELEKSVLASVADDVIVGVKGHRADITIVKKFA